MKSIPFLCLCVEEEERSKFILHLNNSEWICVTCDKKPGSNPSNDDEDKNEDIEASEAS